jgi:5'-nucleotidase
MRILIVNDDGIHAKGILALSQRLAREHDVTVVAPDSERSASSHSITIYRPLRVKKTELPELSHVACFMTDGLPVDCTKIGISYVLKSGVDLVVSGINHGPNLGTDILYSGTVAAALDAVLMGYSALAVSSNSYLPQHLDAAAEVAARVIQSGLFDQRPTGVLYNLNIPDLPLEQIQGIQAVGQGRTLYIDDVDVRNDPHGMEYVWMASRFVKEDAEADTDVGAVARGFAAITPIQFNLTDTSRMPDLKCRIDKIKLHM